MNVSSGQWLILSLPSPFACLFMENLHISKVCSYVVHREHRVRHLSDWVLGVFVWSVWSVCMCVCVCTKGPFLLMEYISLFLLKFWLLPLNHHHLIATTTTSTSTYNYHHHRPPPHSASCSSASGWKEKTTSARWVALPLVQGVFATMAEEKTPAVQVAASDHHYVWKWSTCAGW